MLIENTKMTIFLTRAQTLSSEVNKMNFETIKRMMDTDFDIMITVLWISMMNTNRGNWIDIFTPYFSIESKTFFLWIMSIDKFSENFYSWA
jgi:hypothetical protein